MKCREGSADLDRGGGILDYGGWVGVGGIGGWFWCVEGWEAG